MFKKIFKLIKEFFAYESPMADSNLCSWSKSPCSKSNVKYDNEPGGNIRYDSEPGGNIRYDSEPGD